MFSSKIPVSVEKFTIIFLKRLFWLNKKKKRFSIFLFNINNNIGNTSRFARVLGKG